MKIRKFVILGSLAASLQLISIASLAQQLDANSQKAQDQTVQLLNNSQQRNEAIGQNKDAQSVDSAIKKFTGGNQADQDAVYKITSDVFASLNQKTGGDPAKLQELVNDAMKDPSSFEKLLTPTEQDEIRGLAGKIEKQQGPKP